MNVLVTGGAGFIGSHLCEALLGRGDRVRVVDVFDDAYDPSVKRRNLPKGVELVEADVRAATPAWFHGIDLVFHLAARAGVRASLGDPGLYAAVNVEGTARVLGAAARAGGPPLVFASSSSVYGARGDDRDFAEEDAADRPASPYAASKRAAELFCAASGLDVTAVRLFTVYGPRQRPGMAVERFATAALGGAPIPLYGDPASARDYTEVSDAVAGLLAAAAGTSGFHVVNVAGGRVVRLDALAAAVADAVGVPLRIDRLPAQDGDVPVTRANLDRARSWLGWAPRVDLSAGLRRYVAWRRLSE